MSARATEDMTVKIADFGWAAKARTYFAVVSQHSATRYAVQTDMRLTSLTRVTVCTSFLDRQSRMTPEAPFVAPSAC